MVHCKEANIVFQSIARNGTVYSRQKSRGLVLHESYASSLSSSSSIKEGIQIESEFRGESATQICSRDTDDTVCKAKGEILTAT